MKAAALFLAATVATMPALADGPRTPSEAGAANPLAAVETYCFLLPAIDCDRKSSHLLTLDHGAMQALLDASAAARLGGEGMKDACLSGTELYVEIVERSGDEAYCTTAAEGFGPEGRLIPGLLVPRPR